MTPEEYSNLVTRLAKPLPVKMNVIHAGLGVASESGEITDAIKAALIYGKPFDIVNIVEEAGDLLFFTEWLLQNVGLTIEDAKIGNAAKLNARYAEGFSEAKALGRNKAFEVEQLTIAVWGSVEAAPEPQVFEA